jgi:hypothetical protein
LLRSCTHRRRRDNLETVARSARLLGGVGRAEAILERTLHLRLELSLVSARATPAASELVAVQLRENMSSLADAPTLDELPNALSPEGCEVPLEFIVPGHHTNGSDHPASVQLGPCDPGLERGSRLCV